METGAMIDMDPQEREVRAPAGTVTFLFSDIEGSTQLLQQLGERYPDLLAAHHRILRTAFSQYGGREVDTAGDGFFVAFAGARDAVAAAAACQQALVKHSWPEGSIVRVRMGLHTGEALLSDGTYVGLDVHRAARISAVAYGGQVLLSHVTRELVERDLPPGVSLRDLGMHRLKDLAHPERLFQLVIPGVPSEFPSLKTLGNRFFNLPVQPTTFIGREQEVETVRHLLARDTLRILTLAGPGGTGKTRLSLQAAASLVDQFEDGVCFVPLAAVTDPGLVATTIARTLGLMEGASRPVLDSLKDFLHSKHLLLVLDNFEQVAAAAPVVAELVASCPRVKVLVTSRIILHLSGEYEYQVPALAVPDPRHLPPLDTLPQFAAVGLFVERARAVRPGFSITEENAAAIADICMRLDGLPLAIELAAARVKLLSPQAMRSRLGSRLDLLKGGALDVHPRHHTLRQAIAWSYDLLGGEEMAFFRRLSVFMGGCTLEAADAVCGACDTMDQSCSGCGPGQVDALDAIAGLVDHSLLRQEEGPDGEPRFVMLETIREYGVECLSAAGEEAAVRRAHTEFYLGLAEQAQRELTGPQQVLWLDRLEHDHDNLRAALTWAEGHGEAEIGLRLGAALWRFWIVRGHMVEGRERLERMLALPEEADVPARWRAAALNGLGTLMHEIGDYPAAQPILEESLSIWRALGDKGGMATVLINLGWVLGILGDPGRGEALSMEGLTLCREIGDRRGQAVALNNLSWMAALNGTFAEACDFAEESIALRRAVGDHRGYGYALTILSDLERHRGLYQRASAHIDEALTVLRPMGDKQLVANALHAQGVIAYEQGHLERALMLLEESAALWWDVGNRTGRAETLVDLADVLVDMGEFSRATSLLEEALTLSDFSVWRALASCGKGRIAHLMGDGAQALVLLEKSLALARQSFDQRCVLESLESMADVLVGRVEFTRAAVLLGEAEALREKIGAPLPPRKQTAYARTVDALRAGLGEDGVAVARAEGRAAVATGWTAA